MTDSAGGNEGFVAVKFKAHPTHGSTQQASTGIVHLQGVDAAEIHGDGGRSIDDKLTGRRPDGGMNCTALEREPLPAGAVGNQAKPRTGVDFDAARFIERDGGPREVIGHQGLADS